ncbi:MAG: choice-of-anchor Q domain-containing protein [Rudaea sp.]
MPRNSGSFVSLPRITSLAAALSLALAGAAVSPSDVDAAGTKSPLAHAFHSHQPLHPNSKERGKTPLDMHRAREGALRYFSSLPASRPVTRAATTVHVSRRNDSGAGSLRAALENAVDGDVVDISSLRGKVALSTPLQPNANVTIVGPGRDLLTLDGGHSNRVITSAHSLKISNVTVANGSVSKTNAVVAYEGGCLFVQGSLSISNATFTNCTVDGTANPNGYAYGGAIAVLGSADISSSSITNSYAVASDYAGSGGVAIIAQPGYTDSAISDSVISGNSAVAGLDTIGGGVGAGYHTHGTTATLSVTNSTITGNSLTSNTVPPYYDPNYMSTYYYGSSSGGGIFAQATSLTLTGSNVTSNTTNDNYIVKGAGVYTGTSYYYNSTTYTGSTVGGDVTLTKSSVENNSGSSIYGATSGGGVYSKADFTLDNSVISGNAVQTACASCFAGGGGVYTGKYSNININSSTISGNSATATTTGFANGGGLITKYYFNFGTTFNILNSTISGNTATSAAGPANSLAGGVYQSATYTPAALVIENSTIAFNATGGAGGGLITSYYASVTLNSVILADNTASVAGTEDLAAPGPVTIGGDYNLVQSDPTVTGITFSGTHNIFGQDPLLQPLAYNGGTTQTHALDPTSPAVDKGINPEGLNYDQRGNPYARVVGVAADIGAYELDTDHIFGNGFE